MQGQDREHHSLTIRLETKKSYQADLERRRWRWFTGGLLLSVAVLTAVLMLPVTPSDEWEDSELTEDILRDMELMPIRQEQQMLIASAPEEPKPAEKLKVVEEKLDTKQDDEQSPPPAVEDDSNAEEEEDDKPETTPPAQTISIPDEAAQFPGGPGALAKWLTQHIKYPDKAQQWKQQGQVVVSFVVNTDGTLSDIALTKSATTLLDREVMRAVAEMPRWTPAKLKGQPCRSVVQIPVIFRR